MIFQELQIEYEQEVEEAVKELFQVAYNNQVQENDLLLILIHGFKVKDPENYINNNLSPYVIGPDYIGFEEDAFYKFYHDYRKEVIIKAEFDKHNDAEFKHEEQMTINIEFLIYLKVWENDFFLRQLFNLVRLCNKQCYRWDFKPRVFDSRELLISNKITARIKTLCPKFYKLMMHIYSAQIRGAIAHSKFFFSGDYITLTNKGFRDGFDRGSIMIQDWYIIFNKTVALYNQVLGQRHYWKDYYTRIANENHNGVSVLTPEVNEITGAKRQKFVKPNQFKTWQWEQ